MYSLVCVAQPHYCLYFILQPVPFILASMCIYRVVRLFSMLILVCQFWIIEILFGFLSVYATITICINYIWNVLLYSTCQFLLKAHGFINLNLCCYNINQIIKNNAQNMQVFNCNHLIINEIYPPCVLILLYLGPYELFFLYLSTALSPLFLKFIFDNYFRE